MKLRAICLLVAALQPAWASFVMPTAKYRQRNPGTRFAYRNEMGEGGSRNDGLGDEAALQAPRIIGFNVPLIGPIPGGQPLVLGSELLLVPTPMQWKALEESVLLHRQYIKEQGNSTITGIDAAPLVAFIDVVSGQR